MSGPRRVVLVTPNFENNSLGRTWCLWMLGKELGWHVDVVGVKGRSLWKPLAQTPFAADCRVPGDAEEGVASTRTAIGRADLVVAVKPLTTSFGLALEHTAGSGTPLLLDIDDPDIEVRTAWRTPLEKLKHPGFAPRQRELLRLGALARRTPRLVSNPVLQRMYGGGELVPHVRRAGAAPEWSTSTAPVVRFVGSSRQHKGVEVLRGAVATLAGTGTTLEVTAPAPADARPWERWLGETDLDRGSRLVAEADVIAVPSLPTAWSPAQLPAKLIDAMMAGRAIVASATEPVTWALGDAGVTVPPGDEPALAAALEDLRDPARRRALGLRARERAEERFSVAAVAPALDAAARAAAAGPVVPA